MVIVGGNFRGRLIRALVGALGLAAALVTVTANPADARHRYRGYYHHYYHVHHAQRSYYRPRRRSHQVRYSRGAGGYSPAFAAMIVDGNSGRTLYARNENELRHPASVTKDLTSRVQAGRCSSSRSRATKLVLTKISDAN